MKKLDIVYNTSLKQVQGINYVNNSFVEGQKYFKDNNIYLDKIFSPDGVFDCQTHTKLDLIGSDVNTPRYRKVRKIRVILRNLFSSKFLFGCLVKLYFNTIRPAKKALQFYFKNQTHSDYIIFQDTFTAFFFYKNSSRNKKVKTILILHCSEDPIEQLIPMFPGFFKYRKLEELYRETVRFAMESCDKVVYLSHSATIGSHLPDNHKTFVYNGVEDLKTYEFIGVHSPLNFVIVASVIEHKGQHVLLEAINLLSADIKQHIRLNIIGDGANLGNCKKLAKDYGLNDIVTFWGNRNDVADILQQMDVFILPSISEGMPMSLLEAMRQGLYLMPTCVGGMREMLQPNFGEYVQRDPQAIANAISHVVSNGSVKDEAKLAARNYYLTNFTLCKMISSYSQVLLSL